MSKADFIRSLQYESKPLSPFDISQRLRQTHSCVCIYQGDPELPIEEYRGYMIRFREKRERTPDNPELYVCVVSLRQSKQWQDLVWTKEILQILDRPEHRTASKASLGHMLDSRQVLAEHTDGIPLNVMADKNGFTLAVGSMVPTVYRTMLRSPKSRPSPLEATLPISQEFIPWVLSPQFEQNFEAALSQCDD